MHLYVGEPPNLSKLYQRVWYESCAGRIPTGCQGGAGLPSVIDAKKDSDQVASEAMPIRFGWTVFLQEILPQIGWIGFIASVEHHMFFKIWMEIVDGCFFFWLNWFHDFIIPSPNY